MEPKDVTAYGCDYSAREFSPKQIDGYPGVPIKWLARYIGYPGNPKCISAYPGAYKAHTEAGRPVVLYHQIGYRDFEGGYGSGRTQAQAALADARSKAVGWDGETPIIACFDRRMPAFARGGVTYRAIPLDEVRNYVAGFRSVLGHGTSGFYGFEDTMVHAIVEDWARFTMQCGARSAHVKGISAWQENNEQPLLLGTQTDRLELYIPISDIGGDDEMGLREEIAAAAKDINHPLGEDLRKILTQYQMPKVGGEPDSEGKPAMTSIHIETQWAAQNAKDTQKEIKELKESGIPQPLTISDADVDRIARRMVAIQNEQARDGDPNTGPVS